MRVNIIAKNLTSAEKSQADNYLSLKIDKLEKLSGDQFQDSSVLRATIEKFNKNQAYKVSMVLRSGNKTLYSDEDSFSLAKAIDLAQDKLASQIRKNFRGKKK